LFAFYRINLKKNPSGRIGKSLGREKKNENQKAVLGLSLVKKGRKQ
jgi:hypothetical protein